MPAPAGCAEAEPVPLICGESRRKWKRHSKMGGFSRVLGCVWFRGLDLGDEGTLNHLVRDSHFCCLVCLCERWLGIAIFMFGSKNEEPTGQYGHLFNSTSTTKFNVTNNHDYCIFSFIRLLISSILFPKQNIKKPHYKKVKKKRKFH